MIYYVIAEQVCFRVIVLPVDGKELDENLQLQGEADKQHDIKNVSLIYDDYTCVNAHS